MATVLAQSQAASELLKSLANSRRLEILCALSQGELNVGELNLHIALSQSALSQHLATLKRAGLIASRKQSQVVYYRLIEGPAQPIIHILHNHFCQDVPLHQPLTR